MSQGEGSPASGSIAAPDVEVFPPTLREVMLRPWWIGMLVFALAVAGVFAWLGQWQLARAIDTDPPPPGITETVRPIAEVVEPGDYLPEPLVGQRVDVAGSWIAADFLVVSSRYNGGVEGFWVTGQLRVTDHAAPTSLAVALGWAATREQADAAATALRAIVDPAAPVALTGRLISDEGPQLPPAGAPLQEMTSMSPAALLGWWHEIDALDVYRPYLVAERMAGAPISEAFTSDAGLDGLSVIDSPAPAELSAVNWLNVFYAAEWAIFAGFAFYMWYRLARDAWEKELEALDD